MVIEIGNSWNSKSPTMSTLPLRTLMAVADSGSLHICQQMIWHNPAKLPGPAAWVTVKRKRLTDSFTHIWWYSPHEDPYADNSKVLQPYTKAMEKLLAKQTYNAGKRPSGHALSKSGFLEDKGGSIARSVLSYSNTSMDKAYRDWCQEHGIAAHPARMPLPLAEFFVQFLTKKNGLVMDPFAGSCTTGLAAESSGRRWVCVERDSDYLLGAQGRFIHPRGRQQQSTNKSP
jgi:site-specific DNA-methyltransferase (cytosine-N4-specific)